MRFVVIIVGLALLIAGIWILVGGATYQSSETLLQIGSATLKESHEKALPQWLGIAGIVVGALLALGGLLGSFGKK